VSPCGSLGGGGGWRGALGKQMRGEGEEMVVMLLLVVMVWVVGVLLIYEYEQH